MKWIARRAPYKLLSLLHQKQNTELRVGRKEGELKMR